MFISCSPSDYVTKTDGTTVKCKIKHVLPYGIQWKQCDGYGKYELTSRPWENIKEYRINGTIYTVRTHGANVYLTKIKGSFLRRKNISYTPKTNK